MNTTPNPLIPQGTFLEQKGRSHLRIAVFTILAVHVVLLGSLLMAGCKRTTDQASAEQTNEGGAYPPPPVTALPPADTAPPPAANTSEVVAAHRLTPLPPLPTNVIPPEPSPVPPPPEPTVGAMPSQGEHVVVKGESFYTIAKKYGITSRAIQESNPGVDPARLKIGQKLAIPARSTSAMASTQNGGAPRNGGPTYVVKSGDTLNAIARKHGTTVKDLQAANNLKTTQIKVGQKLRIPAKGNGGGGAASGVAKGPGVLSLLSWARAST
jgi:LysM repeat protein